MEQPPGFATPSRMESAADAASLQSGDSVQKWGGQNSSARAALTVLFRYLDVVLGAVLVLAGALKAQQLLADPSVGRASGLPRWLLLGASAFELAFGCWMLAGLVRRPTRWLALGWFTSLAAVSLAQAVGGAPSCACFGELHIHPWLMFSFDVAAVAALWMWMPTGGTSGRRVSMVLILSLLPSAGLIGLTAAPPNEPLFAEIALGDIAQSGEKQQGFQCLNDSGALVEVAAIETSCPCASIHLAGSEVRAGQFLSGNVTLDLRRKLEFAGNLVIEAKGLTKGGRVAFRLLIRARVVPASRTETGNL
jgi:hypothetical protein